MSKSQSEDEPIAVLHACPCGCGESFSTVNGAAMHAINSEDDQHAEVQGMVAAYRRLAEMEAQ